MAALKCPVCAVTTAWVIGGAYNLGADSDGHKFMESMNCPECGSLIVQMVFHGPSGGDPTRRIVWPRSTNRPPCPSHVPDAIRTDYTESCLVLQDSPKASAALSRRCLQHILRDGAKVKPGNLDQEIDQVIATKALVSSIAENLDAVRVIGNFAAHPTKSHHTGEIIDVEPGEADWNLDVVEALMDVYYVQPAILQAKKAALNAKLAEANKPQLP